MAAARIFSSFLTSSSSPASSLALHSLRGIARRASSGGGARTSSSVAVAVGAVATGGDGSVVKLTVLQSYYALSKFRLSALVVATAAAGFVAASPASLDYTTLLLCSAGTFGASAAANTLNQVIEVARDSNMRRTAKRPLPTKSLSVGHAIAFAAVNAVAGCGLLYTTCGPASAGLAAANIALYAGVYTPLKPISIANTWVGAVVGGIPPLIGWAAARQREEWSGLTEKAAWIVPAIVYTWQLPHFLSLAWLVRGDYAAGGYRMLPLIDATGRRTAAVCLRNCGYLLPVGLAGPVLGMTTWPFAAEATALNIYFATAAMAFFRSPSSESARVLFRRSLWHLPLILIAACYHRIPAGVDAENEAWSWALPGSPSTRENKPEFDAQTAALMRQNDVISAPFPFLPPPRTPVPCAVTRKVDE